VKVALLSISALVFTAALYASPADACTPFSNDSFIPDPAYADDREPPSGVTVKVTTYDSDAQCGWGSSLLLEVSASDDATPPSDLGYQLTVVEGSVEQGEFGDEPISVGLADGLIFYFGAEDLDFTLEVRAVDLNRNVGPPTVVEVHHDGGCLSATPHGALLTTLAPLVLIVRRRRRSTT
jgi:hypothetical protein